jgi:hypothetical protein
MLAYRPQAQGVTLAQLANGQLVGSLRSLRYLPCAAEAIHEDIHRCVVILIVGEPNQTFNFQVGSLSSQMGQFVPMVLNVGDLLYGNRQDA